MSNYPDGVRQIDLDRFYRSMNCQICGEELGDEDFDDEVCNDCSDRIEEDMEARRDDE